MLGMRKHWYLRMTLVDKRKPLLSLPKETEDHCAALWNIVWASNVPMGRFQVHTEISVPLMWILTGFRNEEAHIYHLRFRWTYLGFCPQSHQGWWKCQESLWRNKEKAGFWDQVLCPYYVSPGNWALSTLSLLICTMGTAPCLVWFPR